MSDEHLDDRIKERFARLKAEERARVPDFATMYARAKSEAAEMEYELQRDPKVVPLMASGRSWRRRRWPLAAGTLVAAALASIMLLRPSDADAEFEALVTAFAADSPGWESPTDGLLEVPGLELVNSIPVIGGPYGAPLDDPDTPRSSGDVTG